MTRIDLPWTKPPLSANDTFPHWAVKANIIKNIRQTARQLAHGLPHTDYLTVTLHYQPRDRRRRDAHNLWPTVKACVDGLVDAGIVPDDNTEHVSTPEPVIHRPNGAAAMWLELEYPEESA